MTVNCFCFSRLTEDLTEEDRDRLGELKALQSTLEQQLEGQTQALEEVSVERQRLESLLSDNLFKRKQELLDDSSSTSWRRKSVSRRSAQAKRQEDLQQFERELTEATQAITEIEQKLVDERAIVNRLRSDLIASKGGLEKLRAKDMANSRALEEAQEREERLMNKVNTKLY